MKQTSHQSEGRTTTTSSIFLSLALGSVLTACAVKTPSPTTPTSPTAAVPAVLSPAQPAHFAGGCPDLMTRLQGLPNTRITGGSAVAAGTLKVGGQDIAEHCLVTGKMHERVSPVDGLAYAIGFEMRLPRAWNGRFLHQGNGGVDGVVQPAVGNFGGGPITNALSKGFAVLSSDAGHSLPGASFGIDPQARLDYGYQAVAKLTPVAKSMIAATYGKGPDRSYFGGCSNGGRHAMITAARLPQDYDGYLVGAPGYNLPKAALANLAGARLYATVATAPAIKGPPDLQTAFTDAERQLLSRSILAKCDVLDGAMDGLVQDTAACQATFDLIRDVPTCTAARDGSCLSGAQKFVIAKIFSGTTTSNGERIYSSFPYDPGISGGGIPFWEFTASLVLDSGSVGTIFKVPPEQVAGFNGVNFSLTSNLDALAAQLLATNATYGESAMSFMTPPNPTELGAMRQRGGKMLVYHGVSDSIFSITDTQAWYQGLQANQAGGAASFARVFAVPGMGHCSGGPATDQADFLQPLVDWVEQNRAPEQIVATGRGPGNIGGVNAEVPANWRANRTRPLCPWPKVARYAGTGDIELASSFVCR